MAKEIKEKDFQTAVIEASYSKYILVDFWADWCAPCKALTPILQEVTKNYAEHLTFLKVNIEENQQISAQLKIRSIPNVKLFKDGKIIDEFLGNIPQEQIIHFLEKYMPTEVTLQLKEALAKNHPASKIISFMRPEIKLSEQDEKILWQICKNQLVNLPDAAKDLLVLFQFFSPLEQANTEKNIFKKVLQEELAQEYLSQFADIYDEERQLEIFESLIHQFSESKSPQKEVIKDILLLAFIAVGNGKEIVNEYRKKLTRLIY